MGTLYLVATPIGNLEDITLRALRILREVPLIAAEDTRVARKLLNHFEIDTPTISYHEHSRDTRLQEVVSALADGDVALISDAGMPGISDPGSQLIARALATGHAVIPIPGPSSVTAAAATSGLVDEGYVFGGFLPPRENEKRDRLRRLAAAGLPIILFESPKRVGSLLELLKEIFPQAEIVAGREITKFHEEWLRGDSTTLIELLTERGEFTLVVQPNLDSNSGAEIDLDGMLRDAFDDSPSLRDAVDRVIAASGLPRRIVYQRALEIRGD